jgi:hypothetical protein
MAQQVFSNEVWYIERPEPQENLTGILEPVTLTYGPDNRPALSYLFRMGDGVLPVYAAGIEGLLRSLAGHPVIVLGKRIDFSTLGFSIELWIGEIELNTSKI